MSESVKVSPFFERGKAGYTGFPAEIYVAGFRCASGTGGGVEITLPAEIVERTVLTAALLSVHLSPEGQVVLDGEGLSDEVLEAASAAGGSAIRRSNRSSPGVSIWTSWAARTIRSAT